MKRGSVEGDWLYYKSVKFVSVVWSSSSSSSLSSLHGRKPVFLVFSRARVAASNACGLVCPLTT